MTRKIIQISSMLDRIGPTTYRAYLFALCDDGTLWRQADGNDWQQVESIPQPESPTQ